jgi:hypothetical protein
LIYNDDNWQKQCEAPVVTRGTKPSKESKPRVVFESLEDAPGKLRERVEEITKLKEEGKW